MSLCLLAPQQSRLGGDDLLLLVAKLLALRGELT
jgi:hypothetical protein